MGIPRKKNREQRNLRRKALLGGRWEQAQAPIPTLSTLPTKMGAPSSNLDGQKQVVCLQLGRHAFAAMTNIQQLEIDGDGFITKIRNRFTDELAENSRAAIAWAPANRVSFLAHLARYRTHFNTLDNDDQLRDLARRLRIIDLALLRTSAERSAVKKKPLSALKYRTGTPTDRTQSARALGLGDQDSGFPLASESGAAMVRRRLDGLRDEDLGPGDARTG